MNFPVRPLILAHPPLRLVEPDVQSRHRALPTLFDRLLHHLRLYRPHSFPQRWTNTLKSLMIPGSTSQHSLSQMCPRLAWSVMQSLRVGTPCLNSSDNDGKIRSRRNVLNVLEYQKTRSRRRAWRMELLIVGLVEGTASWILNTREGGPFESGIWGRRGFRSAS